MKTILILGGNHEKIGIPCLQQAIKAGYKVIVSDIDKEPINEIAELADRYVQLDYSNPTACLKFTISEHIDMCYGFREKSVYSVSIVNAFLKNNWTSPVAISGIQNKFTSRSVLRDNGFSQPKVFYCENIEDIWRKYSTLSQIKKYIVKPITSAGSIDVYSLPENFSNAQQNLKGAKGSFLIEEFVEGKEFSVEGISLNGEVHIACFTEKMLESGTFCERGHRAPYKFKNEGYIIKEITRAIKACRLSWGFFHIEFWLQTDNTIVLGELHNRPGG